MMMNILLLAAVITVEVQYGSGVINTFVKCVGDDVTCQFRLGRIMCSRPISRDDLAVMLKDGRTPIFDDFISKRNRPFKASLVISTDGKQSLSF